MMLCATMTIIHFQVFRFFRSVSHSSLQSLLLRMQLITKRISDCSMQQMIMHTIRQATVVVYRYVDSDVWPVIDTLAGMHIRIRGHTQKGVPKPKHPMTSEKESSPSRAMKHTHTPFRHGINRMKGKREKVPHMISHHLGRLNNNTHPILQ